MRMRIKMRMRMNTCCSKYLQLNLGETDSENSVLELEEVWVRGEKEGERGDTFSPGGRGIRSPGVGRYRSFFRGNFVLSGIFGVTLLLELTVIAI